MTNKDGKRKAEGEIRLTQGKNRDTQRALVNGKCLKLEYTGSVYDGVLVANCNAWQENQFSSAQIHGKQSSRNR